MKKDILYLIGLLVVGVFVGVQSAKATTLNHYTASAVCIDSRGYYLTAAHVVQDKVKGTINGSTYTVVSVDVPHDVALVKSSPCAVPAVIGVPRVGDEYTTLGFAKGKHTLHKTTGHVALIGRTAEYGTGEGVGPTFADRIIIPGDSGGAMLTNGKLAGIISGYDNTPWRSLFADIVHAEQLLKSAHIPYKKTGSSVPTIGYVITSTYKSKGVLPTSDLIEGYPTND